MMQATRIPRQPEVPLSLRLASGERFVVTLRSWKKFLARLENNLLTHKPKAQYSPPAEEYWNDAIL